MPFLTVSATFVCRAFVPLVLRATVFALPGDFIEHLNVSDSGTSLKLLAKQLKHPQLIFREPRSNSHAIYSTLIGCIL